MSPCGISDDIFGFKICSIPDGSWRPSSTSSGRCRGSTPATSTSTATSVILSTATSNASIDCSRNKSISRLQSCQRRHGGLQQHRLVIDVWHEYVCINPTLIPPSTIILFVSTPSANKKQCFATISLVSISALPEILRSRSRSRELRNDKQMKSCLLIYFKYLTTYFYSL